MPAASTCRVLLVDDEVDFAEAMATRLARRGYAMAVAHDAEEAARAVREHAPDVIVLDVRLPGEDGVSFLGRLKRDHPDVEVILLTGHASVGTGIQGMRGGAFDYVLKPVEIDELCARLEAAWARRRARSSKPEVPR